MISDMLAKQLVDVNDDDVLSLGEDLHRRHRTDSDFKDLPKYDIPKSYYYDPVSIRHQVESKVKDRESRLRRFSYENNFTPNEQQSLLVPMLYNWYMEYTAGKSNKQYFSLSGPAGSGKTTIIRYAIEYIGLSIDQVACAAYVGKAVTVLNTHGLNSRTVHSLIYVPTVVTEMDENGNPLRDRNGDPIQKVKFFKREELDYPYALIIIDEASMINDQLRDEILSFGVPVIFIGDMNQLEPIFGKGSVMLFPDFSLTQIMRQKENDPIIQLSQMAIKNIPYTPGVYGKSRVITSLTLNRSILTDYDVIIVGTNKRRESLNNYIRSRLLNQHSIFPIPGERMICRQNNWNISIGNGLFLTNGTAGDVMDVYRAKSTKYFEIDFKSDVSGQTKKKLKVDLQYLKATPDERKNMGMSKYNKFEYGYAITAHLSQGSQYPKVLFIDEPFGGDLENRCKLRYTAITRASEAIDILIPGRRL